MTHRPPTSTLRLGALALAAIGLLALSQSAQAQDRGPRDDGPRVERQIERLTQALDLSDAQVVELRAVFEAQAAERQSNRAEMRERREQAAREVEAVLSPDQVERLRALRETRRERGGQRRDGRGNG